MAVTMNPNSAEAYRFFSDVSLCLARMEMNGLNIDIALCRSEMSRLSMEIQTIEKDILTNTPEGKALKKTYPDYSLNSNHQIQNILYNVFKYVPVKQKEEFDDEGISYLDYSMSTEEASLSKYDTDFCKKLIVYRKLYKVCNTYLRNIIRQTIDGKVHPTFSVCLVSSFRSSSFDPNFQNMPIRDKNMGKIIRSTILPSRDYKLLEVDFSGAEVRCGACYHKDPNMITYITDPTTDMHRDMAAQIYMLEQSDVSKDIRYTSKNMFVFPEFYGDWYESCAKTMWDAVDRMDLKTVKGVSLREHLKRKKLETVEKFITHLAGVEDDFWNNRFAVYGEWKNKLWESYIRKGYTHTLTGFTVQGVSSKKVVCNIPIQGSAAHWLLWSILAIEKFIIRHGLKSKLLAQIHDSVLIDLHPDEEELLINEIRNIMTTKLRKHWKWINVPVEVEMDITPIDGSWHTKEAVKH